MRRAVYPLTTLTSSTTRSRILLSKATKRSITQTLPHRRNSTEPVISIPESNSPDAAHQKSHSAPIAPYIFETGLALFAKRPPRPFPPPFLSPPSGSFSEPLSTHNRSRDRRAFVNGELIRGYTNGDDAVYASDLFIGANDGVGAWSTREGGHAGYDSLPLKRIRLYG